SRLHQRADGVLGVGRISGSKGRAPTERRAVSRRFAEAAFAAGRLCSALCPQRSTIFLRSVLRLLLGVRRGVYPNFNQPISPEYDPRPRLARNTVPTLVVLGRYDYNIPFREWDRPR